MKRKANKEKMKICLVGSSGGHLTHLYMLKPFWKDKDRFWVTFDKEDARSILEGEKMYPCYYPTNRSLKALIKYNYVQRNNSIMSAKISPKRFNSVEAFCETFRFYQENGLSDINCDVVKRLGQHFFDLNGRINLFICTNEERQYIKNTKKRFYDVDLFNTVAVTGVCDLQVIQV